MERDLRIGTRRSPLALWQAEHVKALIEQKHPGIRCELVHIVTQGDKILDTPLAQVGGKGLFVKELENALLAKEVDLAVHSMKDMPTELPTGLFFSAIPPREDARDVLVCREPGISIDDLPQGARIGTSSLRRASQLLHYRSDLIMEPLRGNVGTRLGRIDQGDFDAIVLAAAGLKRLGLLHRASQFLPHDICLPAAGQGALAIETREDDPGLAERLTPLHDSETAVCVSAERSFLEAMQGSCQIPVACQAAGTGDTLDIQGLIASLDGTRCIRRNLRGPQARAEQLGRELASDVLNAGGDTILAEILGEDTCPTPSNG